MVEEPLQRDALAVQEQLAVRVEDPQVAEHLALVREEGGVAAGPRRERLDVVGDLTVEELLGVGAGQRELAALGAFDQRAAARERLVVGLRDVGDCHASNVAIMGLQAILRHG